MKKNILITGISGMLGNSIYKLLSKDGNFNLYGISRKESYQLEDAHIFHGDLKSINFISTFNDIFFYAVIHCSAEINVNRCEIEKEDAYNSNVKSTQNLVELVKAEKYIYISTDSVFDGKLGNYDEKYETNPLNYYAQTKLEAEFSVLKSVRNYYILRTNIYGFSKPFKNSLFEWAYNELSESNKISGFSNIYFNPLYVGQLAEFIKILMNSDLPFGIYNASSDEVLSKYDFLNLIADSFEFKNDLIRKTNFIQSEGTADRALNTTLNNLKIKNLLKDFNFSVYRGFEMLKVDFFSTFKL